MTDPVPAELRAVSSAMSAMKCHPQVSKLHRKASKKIASTKLIQTSWLHRSRSRGPQCTYVFMSLPVIPSQPFVFAQLRSAVGTWCGRSGWLMIVTAIWRSDERGLINERFCERCIPSKKLTYPTLGKGKSSTQKYHFGSWYVSSQEGIPVASCMTWMLQELLKLSLENAAGAKHSMNAAQCCYCMILLYNMF